MKSKKEYSFYREKSGIRSFLVNLIDSISILLCAFILLGTISVPIYYGVVKEKEEEATALRKEMTEIGLESKLLHVFDDGAAYSLNNFYAYWVRVLLKYTYENSDYDMDSDPDNYKEFKNEFDVFPSITNNPDYVDDDFIGYYYTKYAVDKVDSENNKIVDYKGKDPKQYFYEDVLLIGEDNKFFEKPVDGNYPLLKKEVRTDLFTIHLMNISKSEYDNEFFAFFTTAFENAGNLLLKEERYHTPYIKYVDLDKDLQLFYSLSIVLSISIAYIVSLGILPIFFRYKRTIGHLVMKNVMLDEEMDLSFKSHALRFGYGLIRHFYLIMIIGFAIHPSFVFNNLFYIFVMPISLFMIVLLTLTFNVISVGVAVTRRDGRNIENLLTNTAEYRMTRKKLID